MEALDMVIWSRVQVMMAGAFTVACTVILVPWRKPMKVMIPVASLGIVFLVAISIYSYFFSNITLHLFWWILAGLLVVATYMFSVHRDVRTIFTLLSIFGFNVSASILTIVCSRWVESLPLKVTITLGIHLLYLACCIIIIRRPLFSLLEVSNKGWLVGCVVPGLPLLAQLMLTNVEGKLSGRPELMPVAVVVSLMVLGYYIVFAKLLSRVFERYKMEQFYQAMSLQVNSMEKQMEEAVLQQKKAAIFRHDLRHFISLIDASIQNRQYDDAKSAVEGLRISLSAQEKSMAEQFCKHSTVNSLMTYFASYAEVRGVKLESQIVLDQVDHIDKVELAVLLANTVENAIHACMKEPKDGPRVVRVKMHMAGQQLFIVVSNSCTRPVSIEESTGLPRAENVREGHGVGLVSVRAFARKYNAQLSCEQGEGWLNLRMVV